MLINYSDLSSEALLSIAKEWVVSKTSDTETHPQISEWTQQTIEKVKAGELVIEFSEENQSVYLKSKDQIELHNQAECNE